MPEEAAGPHKDYRPGKASAMSAYSQACDNSVAIGVRHRRDAPIDEDDNEVYALLLDMSNVKTLHARFFDKDSNDHFE
jgi:hypothetical protein